MVFSEKSCYGYGGSVHCCQLMLSQCVCVQAHMQNCMRKRSLDEVAVRVHVVCARSKENSGKGAESGEKKCMCCKNKQLK